VPDDGNTKGEGEELLEHRNRKGRGEGVSQSTFM
jgi:hypothetical protein